MGRIPSRFLMVSVGVALALVGCSSGNGSAGERRDVPRNAPETTTTDAPARIDLSQPIPGGSLHGTPRPPLENTGDDYVAIFESLMANFRWLTENPDLSVISELFVPGTPGHDVRINDYQYLTDNQYHWADEGYRLISTDVVSTEGGAVSLRVVQQVDFERIVDSAGNQVGDVRPHEGPDELTFLLITDDTGKWRIADSTRVGDAVVVL